ncbi:hypothetical protein PUN28_002799 [Cardiocondyla obscurior]|uniref:Uncharacterized protein n=1 Tax=Cardiocondyla obscurior TaxID=286306 RepID=A0AAW2GW37_9HYME
MPYSEWNKWQYIAAVKRGSLRQVPIEMRGAARENGTELRDAEEEAATRAEAESSDQVATCSPTRWWLKYFKKMVARAGSLKSTFKRAKYIWHRFRDVTLSSARIKRLFIKIGKRGPARCTFCPCCLHVSARHRRLTGIYGAQMVRLLK